MKICINITNTIYFLGWILGWMHPNFVGMDSSQNMKLQPSHDWPHSTCLGWSYFSDGIHPIPSNRDGARSTLVEYFEALLSHILNVKPVTKPVTKQRFIPQDHIIRLENWNSPQYQKKSFHRVFKSLIGYWWDRYPFGQILRVRPLKLWTSHLL